MIRCAVGDEVLVRGEGCGTVTEIHRENQEVFVRIHADDVIVSAWEGQIEAVIFPGSRKDAEK